MPNKVLVTKSKIDAIADAIITKTGDEAALTLEEMAQTIEDFVLLSSVPTQSAISITPTTSAQIAVSSGKYLVGDITVAAIPSQYIVPEGNKSITSNGNNIDVTNYATVSVNVPSSSQTINLQEKTNITPTEISQTITPDSGYDALSSVQINAISSTYVGSNVTRQAAKTVTPTESEQTAVASDVYTTGVVKVGAISSTYVGSDITQRSSTDLTVSGATVTVPAGYYDEDASKNVATTTHPKPTVSINSSTGVVTASHTQGTGYVTGGTTTDTLSLTTQAAKTVTPTESEQNAVASGVYTTGIIKVGAISSTYIGSGIDRNDSNDIIVSGSLVTIPAGYYSTQTTKSVAPMTLPTTAASSATSGYTSKATIGRSTSAQYINIPVGYNTSGAYYVISATPNGTVTAPSSVSGSTATVSTGTNTLTLTKTVSITPNVTTAGYISSGTAGNATVTLTANVTTKAAATITPGTTNQTIASDTYLTGTQTIAGDANLVAANIKAGTAIFNITGTYTSDATASAADIVDGETAYVNGRMLTGTLVIQKYYTGSSAPSASLGANGDIYIQQ